MSKTQKITINNTEISILTQFDKDFICLTDMVKNMENSHILIGNWLRKKDTIEYLGIWESLNNPFFKLIEFDEFKKNAGLNRFTLSPKNWIEKTNAIGIISKSGKYGGTYAHKDIAFNFAMWISPALQLLIIKEFQRLKEEEAINKNINWDYQRFLAKTNYTIQTDSIQKNIITALNIEKDKEGIIYAEEADLLNLAVFGMKAKQWREENQTLALKGLNIRDAANINQLTVISNLQSYNAILIEQNIDKLERFKKLSHTAQTQLISLSKQLYTYSIESPNKVKYEESSTFENTLKAVLTVPPPKKDNI